MSPDGLILYDEEGAHPMAVSPGSGYEGLFTDLRGAVLNGLAPGHEGRWGKRDRGSHVGRAAVVPREARNPADASGCHSYLIPS